METKTFFTNKKNFKDLVIYFTIYAHNKSLKMLSLHYDESVGKIKEHEGKKYLMVDNYILNKY